MFEQQSSNTFYLVITRNYKSIPTYSHSYFLPSFVKRFLLLCFVKLIVLKCFMNSFNSPILDAIGGLQMKNYYEFKREDFRKRIIFVRDFEVLIQLDGCVCIYIETYNRHHVVHVWKYYWRD